MRHLEKNNLICCLFEQDPKTLHIYMIVGNEILKIFNFKADKDIKYFDEHDSLVAVYYGG